MKRETSRERNQRILIIILALLLMIAVVLLILQASADTGRSPGQTAVIETNSDEVLTDTSGGSIRIKINPVVDVSGSVMNNLNFANYNEERFLRCRILIDEEYIYDSGLIASGDMLIGDYIKAGSLSHGENEAIAEIYSYDTSESLLGQTNVKITLNMAG